MKMTIEKIIKIYNELDRIGGVIIRGNSEEDTKYNSETIEALQSINVILHKYQKIKEIVVHYRENVRDKVTNENMEKILEVIEDGNDD